MDTKVTKAAKLFFHVFSMGFMLGPKAIISPFF